MRLRRTHMKIKRSTIPAPNPATIYTNLRLSLEDDDCVGAAEVADGLALVLIVELRMGVGSVKWYAKM